MLSEVESGEVLEWCGRCGWGVREEGLSLPQTGRTFLERSRVCREPATERGVSCSTSECSRWILDTKGGGGGALGHTTSYLRPTGDQLGLVTRVGKF